MPTNQPTNQAYAGSKSNKSQRIFNTKNKYFIYCIIYGYILFLTYLYPMHSWDEFGFAEQGNPWILQYQQFLEFHGRFFTHILARYTLQLGYPFVYIFKSLAIAILFFVSLKTIDASALKNTDRSFFLLLSIFLLINALFPFTMFMMYYSSDLLIIYSDYIRAIFMIIFIQYYLNIFKNKTNINIYIFCFLAFLTGSIHETAIALIPLIITIYILLKLIKIDIPKWFWTSIPFFLAGFSLIIFAPGNNNRILVYSDALNWDFFGQTLNWTELGYKKYFYSFIRNVFYTSANGYSSPGFLASTWYTQLLIFIFTFLNFKKYKNIFHINILFPLLYWLLSWYICIVMSASPLYHSITIESTRFFMYISLTASIYYYLKEYSSKIQTILISLFLLVVFIGQGIQMPAIYKAKQEYLMLVEQIESGSITEVKHNPTAKVGNITIIKFGNSLYYKYPHIKFSYTN